jgi:flagellar biosynthesis protein FliQ
MLIVAICILLLASAYDAHAYLDPGTGSYVLQIVIAGIVSALFTLKMFWRRIVDFFSGLFKGKK